MLDVARAGNPCFGAGQLLDLPSDLAQLGFLVEPVGLTLDLVLIDDVVNPVPFHSEFLPVVGVRKGDKVPEKKRKFR